MRVLVVEDARRLADGIGEGLRDEGMAVDVSYDGIDALSKVAVNRYDVVVLDRDLPGVHGDAVCREIIELDEGPMVLMLTAADEPLDRVAGLRVGADDYLTKPFAYAELMVRIKALLRRPPTGHSYIVRVADLELDRLTQKVRRAGKRIDLTGKEYALLEYFAANAGRVLTRTMIMEHVWDESFEGLTNIVDVYVRHLRAKVDDAHEQKLIRTVRGAGYCLTEEESGA